MTKKRLRVVIEADPHNFLFPGKAEEIAAKLSASLGGPATDYAVFIQMGNQLVCVREHQDG